MVPPSQKSGGGGGNGSHNPPPPTLRKEDRSGGRCALSVNNRTVSVVISSFGWLTFVGIGLKLC